MAGYEGIVPDRKATSYLVEDSGGRACQSSEDGGVGTSIKQPNSFVYRFVPTHRAT